MLVGISPLDQDQQISDLRDVYDQKPITPGRRAWFAVLKVGDTVSHVLIESDGATELSVLQEPEETPEYEDHSHSGIYGTYDMPEEDESETCKLIVETVKNSHRAIVP